MKSNNQKFNALANALFVAMRHEDGNALPVLHQAQEFMKMEADGYTKGMTAMIHLMELKLGTYKHPAVKLYFYIRDNATKMKDNQDHFDLVRGIEYALHSAAFGNFTHLNQMYNEIITLQRKVPA